MMVVFAAVVAVFVARRKHTCVSWCTLTGSFGGDGSGDGGDVVRIVMLVMMGQ